MVRTRTASVSIRFLWAALFVLLLSMRSLTPAGFMPAFDRGSITIVACPDASPSSAMPMHHHGDHKSQHQPCPYASVSTLGALGPDWAPLIDLPLFAVLLLFGTVLLPIAERDRRRRPPATGPPLPA